MMKAIIACAFLSMALGCVATSYHKVVTVHKNAEGKVTEIIVVEELTQPNRQEEPVQFKHIHH
jgi:hypothetical protein